MNRLRAALGLAIGIPLYIILTTGCVPALKHDPLYNGEVVPQVEAPPDTIRVFLIHIENNRTKDALPPHFIITGSGRHDLGIIEGMGGHLDRPIDTAWLDGERCMTIIAHYIGGGDLVFDRTCWKKGERVTASLDNIFVPGSSWSHR